jgi:hypothetical protein
MDDMTNSDPQQKVTEALRSLIEEAEAQGALITPRGYSHLGIAILDAVFSLRSRYDSVVVPTLKRYCKAAGLDWSDLDAVQPEHGAQALVDFLGPKSTEERCKILTKHVAPGTNTRKADLCVDISRLLVDKGVDTHTSLAVVLEESPDLEWEIRELPGVGPAAWRYLLNLSKVEKVKPDTMIVRWVSEVLDETVEQKEAARLIEVAASEIQGQGVDPSVRTLDHLIWRQQSKRPLTAAGQECS